MKHWSIVCVALVAVTVSANPAQAGRRARRAARATAIVAAATGGAAVVAAAPRRRAVVVAAAPVSVVVAAAPAVVAAPAAPDLTVIDVSAELDVLCITVRNIGTAASPETRLQLDLAQLSDGAFLGGALCRVPPLAVGQSVRIRLRSAPFPGMQATAFVDPAQQVAELDELNNDLAASFVAPEPVVEPLVLETEAVWGAAAE